MVTRRMDAIHPAWVANSVLCQLQTSRASSIDKAHSKWSHINSLLKAPPLFKEDNAKQALFATAGALAPQRSAEGLTTK